MEWFRGCREETAIFKLLKAQSMRLGGSQGGATAGTDNELEHESGSFRAGDGCKRAPRLAKYNAEHGHNIMRKIGTESLLLFSVAVEASALSANTQVEITMLLQAIQAGEAGAQSRLVERIYDELRELAGQLMQQEQPGHTLQPTALANEAVARLLSQDALAQVPNRRYLFAAAAQAMRRILVDHARHRSAEKRGGNRQRQSLDAVLEHFAEQKLDVLCLHDALETLATFHARQSQVVSLRYFGNFTMAEVAELLEVSVATVEKDFRIARAWLRQQLGGETP